MSEEIIQDKATVTILGVELTKKPFTQAEMDEWARIHDERRVDEAQKRFLTLSGDSKRLSNKRVQLQEKAVEALEAKLDREYDRDEWNPERIARLTDQIVTETEKLEELRHEDQGRFADSSFAIADEIDEVTAVIQEAQLEMAHVIAGRPRSFQEWLEAARDVDYQAARDLLQAGLTPFANRRTRRARSGKGTR